MKTTRYQTAGAFCFLTALGAANLLPEGDFEHWETYSFPKDGAMKMEDSHAPAKWKCSGSGGAIARDTVVTCSGQASARLTPSPDASCELLFAPVPVKGNTTYVFTFWVRAENLAFTKPGQTPWGGVMAAPESRLWHDKKGDIAFVRQQGTFEWRKFSKRFTTRPTDIAAMVRFSLPAGSGTLWLDGYTLEEAGK